MAKGRHTVPPPGRITEEVSVDVMTQLDPAAEVEGGLPPSREHILGEVKSGKWWRQLAPAALFSFSAPCLFHVSPQGWQSPRHLYPWCLAQPAMLQALRLFVE